MGRDDPPGLCAVQKETSLKRILVKQKIQDALKSFVPLQVILVVAVIALRIFEWSVTSSSRPGASLATSLWYDIMISHSLFLLEVGRCWCL
jgi:hypothetical protein